MIIELMIQKYYSQIQDSYDLQQTFAAMNLRSFTTVLIVDSFEN
jgi:hypothetical protein